MLDIGVKGLEHGETYWVSGFRTSDMVGLRFSPSTDNQIYAKIVGKNGGCGETPYYFTDVTELGLVSSYSHRYSLVLKKNA